MISQAIRHYLIALFLVFTTIVSAAHQHNDLKKHTDCQICTLSFSVENQESSVAKTSVESLELFRETPYTKPIYFHLFGLYTTYNSRAPPHTASV